MARWNVGRVTGAARSAAAALKAEYEAGRRGDEAPTSPLWRSPREQLDAVLGLLRAAKAEPVTDAPAAHPSDAADDPVGDTAGHPVGDTVAVAADAVADADADAVAEALHGVDWQATRATMAERTTEAARTVRSMAEQVDWGRVQPVAAQVSSALIAAVAAGQLPLGGRLGPTVARAIVDQGGFGRRVGAAVQRRQDAAPSAPTVPDLRGAIEATSREA